MRLASILALLALFAQGQDERVSKWNAFAHAANDYINTVAANAHQRAHDKEHLNELWQAIYQCACF